MSLHLEMAPDVGIREADDIAERVKAALRDEPGIQDAQTHLEPLEQPVATHPAQDRDHPEDSERRRISRLVVNRTASDRGSYACCMPPRSSRFVSVVSPST